MSELKNPPEGMPRITPALLYDDRRYTCLDPEGHWWSFATHVRDVSEEELANMGG